MHQALIDQEQVSINLLRVLLDGSQCPRHQRSRHPSEQSLSRVVTVKAVISQAETLETQALDNVVEMKAQVEQQHRGTFVVAIKRIF